MKKTIFIIVFLVAPLINIIAATFTCSGACPAGSGCITWTITYEVDCAGNIETFDALYYEGGYSFSYENEGSAPGFIGMDPTSLGEDCKTETCI